MKSAHLYVTYFTLIFMRFDKNLINWYWTSPGHTLSSVITVIAIVSFSTCLDSARAANRRPHGLTSTWWGCCGLCLWHKPTELARTFLFSSCVCFCLYSPFSCVSAHKFSRQLSAFSLCSSGLISALLVLSTMFLFMTASLSPDNILCG